MDLEEVKSRVIKGENLEEILDTTDWKSFEDFCARILEEHGWSVKKNFRFKCEGRHEIDILALKQKEAMAIDCKYWGIRKGKASQLRAAARKQKQRADELRKINPLDLKDVIIHPIIITWFEEDILDSGGVWIVPVFKLNSFLLERDKYL